MSNIDCTPVKSPPAVVDDAMAITPLQVPHDSNCDYDEEELMGSFSAMKVVSNGIAKRLADNYTIEGSPVNAGRFKRQDLHPTPLKIEEPVMRDAALFPPHAVNQTPTAATRDVNKKLLVICSASEEHNTGDHQENALRTALLCGPEGCLRRPALAGSIDWINSDNLRPAPLTDLLRVHEYTYLRYLDEKCKASVGFGGGATNSGSSSGAERSKSAMALPAFYAPPGMLDSDTPLQPQSLEAAKRFCGAAILAVDHVMKNRSPSSDAGRAVPSSGGGAAQAAQEQEQEQQVRDRAFVIGRPPGHHAGPHGCVPSPYFWQRPDMASSGFCLLNTVAVAAAYARHQYGRWAWRTACMQGNPVQGGPPSSSSSSAAPHPHHHQHRVEWRAPRIAIVDIDVHHGNGTEEIVRNLNPQTVHLPLPSSWAPVSTLSYKPWLNERDSEEVFFSSVHLYAAERFYPCSGPDSFPAATGAAESTASRAPLSPNEHIVNVALTPIGPGPWDRKARAKLTVPQRDLLCKQASAEFRAKVSSMLLPRIAKFNPDLIFISAGFDAHYDDMYHFLTEQDLHWVTEELCAVASRSGGEAGCGVISVLEGGYSLSTPVVAKPTKLSRTGAAGSAAGQVPAPVIAGNAPEAPSAAVPVPPVAASTGAATSSSATAELTLGRGGRLKAKKEKAAGGTGAVTLPVEWAHALGGIGSLQESPEAKPSAALPPPAAVAVKEDALSSPAAAVLPVGSLSGTREVDMHSMFAQRPGDGGLVKGVLAHAAALVGSKAWTPC